MNRINKKGVFGGILFILAGLLLIISKLGWFGDINVFTVVITIVLIACAINGLVKAKFGQLLFSLAFLAILFDERLGITELTPWTVLVAALFGTIGLNMIFKKKIIYTETYDHNGGFNVNYKKKKTKKYEETIDIGGGKNVHCAIVFGSTTKYINCNDFEGANLENVFGSLIVYLDNAMMAGAQAYVNVDTAFSTTKIFIPKHWKVIQNLDLIASSVKERGYSQWLGDGDILYLNGDICFGSLEIIYV